MPGRNQTGPAGQGPMTGRGMGVCGGNAGNGQNAGTDGTVGNGAGRGFSGGFGRGRGNGAGRGRGFGGHQAASSGKEALEQRIALLRSELEKTERALSETKDTQ